MRNHNRLFYIFSSLSLIFVFIVIIIALFWLNYPYKPLYFRSDKFKVINPVVSRGESLFYISDYCKNMPLPATVTRQFVNDIIFTMPSSVTNNEIGCRTKKFQLSIPKDLPPGKYNLLTIYNYQVNPIRDITIEHESEDFIVK